MTLPGDTAPLPRSLEPHRQLGHYHGAFRSTAELGNCLRSAVGVTSGLTVRERVAIVHALRARGEIVTLEHENAVHVFGRPGSAADRVLAGEVVGFDVAQEGPSLAELNRREDGSSVAPRGRTTSRIEAPSPMWGLRRFSVLAGLPDAAWRALADAASARQCARGTVLHVRGEPADAVYCLRGGRVSALWEPEVGQTINVGDFGPGDIFGETCLWTAAPASREDTSITTSPALLTIVPRIVFRQVLDEHPYVERALVAQSISRRDATRHRLCDALNLGLRARVIGQLLRLAEAGHDTPEGRTFTLARQRELAALVVCTRESVTLELGRLDRERLIFRVGRKVIVPDLDRLRAAAYAAPGARRLPSRFASVGARESMLKHAAP